MMRFNGMLIAAWSESHELWDLAGGHAFTNYFITKMKTGMYAEAGKWSN